MGKVRVVNSKSLAGALIWLGFEYQKDEEDNFVFERTKRFDYVWKDLHYLRSIHYKKQMEEKKND